MAATHRSKIATKKVCKYVTKMRTKFLGSIHVLSISNIHNHFYLCDKCTLAFHFEISH